MGSSITWLRISSSVALAALALVSLDARAETPKAQLFLAPRIELPARIDSSNPAVWARAGNVLRLFVISSWGGIPVRSSGNSLDTLRPEPPVTFRSHPGDGVWMEAIIPDGNGTWYGYYHHERPADGCGRSERQLPRVGAMRSTDNGATWDDLGIVIDAPDGSEACDSGNRFVLGGVGDVTAALDADRKDVYLYYSQYVREGASQGVVVARIAWADRDAPVGKASIWNRGAWLPATRHASGNVSYPLATPLVPARQPFHDRTATNDVFWGPSIHWNTYLRQYVMVMNRAEDEQFGQEGIYISYSPTLADPSQWTAPALLMSGGQWYPQVIGEERGVGTDRTAGKQARFFMFGHSSRLITFDR
jgi:hypothetical protein